MVVTHPHVRVCLLWVCYAADMSEAWWVFEGQGSKRKLQAAVIGVKLRVLGLRTGLRVVCWAAVCFVLAAVQVLMYLCRDVLQRAA